MAKDLRFSLLLEYYRDLLSDKQAEMLECYYDLDLSLSEISENVVNVPKFSGLICFP